MNPKIKARMEEEKQRLLNKLDYQEGESCSFYMSEIDAFKTGFKEGAQWMHDNEVVPRDELIDRLRKHAMHWKTCDIYFLYDNNGKCSCGFAELCNDLERFEKGGEG